MRGGVVNLLMRLPRSNSLTVGYRIRDGYSERLALPTDAAGVKPTMQKLIPAIRPFAVPMMVRAGELVVSTGDPWQCMTLHSPQWGEIERIWLLRGPQLS